MESVLAILSSKWSIAAIIPILLWVIGKFSKSQAYISYRATWGRIMFRTGKAISTIGNAKFGAIYEPIEAPISDYGLFGVEQFFAGMRSDNVKEIEEHVARLKSVGSKFRVEGLELKLDLLRNPTDITQDDVNQAATRARMLGGIDASMKDKLKE